MQALRQFSKLIAIGSVTLVGATASLAQVTDAWVQYTPQHRAAATQAAAQPPSASDCTQAATATQQDQSKALNNSIDSKGSR